VKTLFLSPPPDQEGDKMRKVKTHSGAKKRLVALKSGKVKRKQKGKRHLLLAKNSKSKRLLSKTAYIHASDLDRINRMLGLK
jgi:large subunit ribosomal protein L35